MKPTRQKRGCGYWFRLLTFGVIGGLLVACTGIEVVYIETVTRPVPGVPCCSTLGDRGLNYEQVTLLGN